MRWLVLGVVVFSGCECGIPSGMDAGSDAGVVVEVDAGRDAGSQLDGSISISFDGSFGDVNVGAFLDLDGRVRNDLSTFAHVELQLVDAGSFSVVDGGSAFDVVAGGEGGFTVRFAPTAFGPATGVLVVDGKHFALSGRGTGASLRVPATVDFGTVPLYPGPPAVDERLITLENVGAGVDVQLTFEVVAIDGDASELCVADCFPGIMRVRPGEPLEVSVKLTAPNVGMRRYEVRIFSNDLAEPLKTIIVTANVVARPLCNYSLTGLNFGVLSENEERRLPLVFENVGTEPCELASAEISPTTPALTQTLFTLEQPAAFPVLVAPGQSMTLLVRANAPRPTLPSTFTSTLLITLNTPQRYAVSALRAELAQACQFVGLTRPLQFGEVAIGCSSMPRPLEVLRSGCVGTASAPLYGSLGPQFQLSVPPLAPTVRFTPTATGDVRDTLRVDWTWATQYTTTVELLGTGVSSAQRTESFTVAAREKTDLLFVIEDSPTMQAYQANLNTRLPPLVNWLTINQVDFQIGVISAGDSTNLGALRATPSGQRIIRSPQALLDVLGVSGTTVGQGACKEAALRALAFPAIGAENRGFRRADATLQIVCITDRPDADDALGPQVMELARAGSLSWHAIAPTTPNPPCTRTTSSTGHMLLTGLTGGARDEICGTWDGAIAGISQGLRRHRFTLASRPDAQGVEVRLNGVVLPSTSGMQLVWSFDAAANAVVFTPLFVPSPGEVVTVTYSAECAP